MNAWIPNRFHNFHLFHDYRFRYVLKSLNPQIFFRLTFYRARCPISMRPMFRGEPLLGPLVSVVVRTTLDLPRNLAAGAPLSLSRRLLASASAPAVFSRDLPRGFSTPGTDATFRSSRWSGVIPQYYQRVFQNHHPVRVTQNGQHLFPRIVRISRTNDNLEIGVHFPYPTCRLDPV